MANATRDRLLASRGSLRLLLTLSGGHGIPVLSPGAPQEGEQRVSIAQAVRDLGTSSLDSVVDDTRIEPSPNAVYPWADASSFRLDSTVLALRHRDVLGMGERRSLILRTVRRRSLAVRAREVRHQITQFRSH